MAENQTSKREESPEMRYTSDITVRRIQDMGGDYMILAAMQVSTNGEDALRFMDLPTEESAGKIRYLMKHRHGTPFEHSALTMFIHAPILVWREWHRHRIGFSYNEESGRYKTLEPCFYIPPRERPMMKVDNWKPGRPKFLTLDECARIKYPQFNDRDIKFWADGRYNSLCGNLKHSYRISYEMYLNNLAMEIDPGLARDCLPVGIYSSCWVTCNPRSLMSFLSLRTHEPEAKFPSYPLYEIEVAARVAEQFLKEGWPITYAAWNEFGRVAP